MAIQQKGYYINPDYAIEKLFGFYYIFKDKFFIFTIQKSHYYS